MDTHTKQQQVKDFFLLEKPKHTIQEISIYCVVFLGVCFPILKVSLTNSVLPMLTWVTIIVATYMFYWKPRYERHKRYSSRISPTRLNNYLLENCKTKILSRAINYLEIDTENMTEQQFIIIPYPVFHKTKKIKR